MASEVSETANSAFWIYIYTPPL